MWTVLCSNSPISGAFRLMWPPCFLNLVFCSFWCRSSTSTQHTLCSWISFMSLNRFMRFMTVSNTEEQAVCSKVLSLKGCMAGQVCNANRQAWTGLFVQIIALNRGKMWHILESIKLFHKVYEKCINIRLFFLAHLLKYVSECCSTVLVMKFCLSWREVHQGDTTPRL